VVRVIAEHHGGSVTATNLIDDTGVTIKVTLPRFLTIPNQAFAAS